MSGIQGYVNAIQMAFSLLLHWTKNKLFEKSAQQKKGLEIIFFFQKLKIRGGFYCKEKGLREITIILYF